MAVVQFERSFLVYESGPVTSDKNGLDRLIILVLTTVYGFLLTLTLSLPSDF